MVAAFALTIAAAQAQDTLNVAWSAGIDRLHPLISSNGPDMMVMANIYDTLLRLNPDSGELMPHVAVAWEAEDDLTWRFELRDGVTFTNGEPLDAAAVEYSIEAMLALGSQSGNAPRIANISDVEVVDDLTVRIHTKAPFPELPYRMQPVGGSGRVFLVPPQYFSENTPEYVQENPIGSGPYRLTELRRGQYVKLDVNPDYWGDAPEFETVFIHFIPEASTRIAALLSGEMDLVQRLPFDDEARIAAAPGVHVIEDPSGLVLSIVVDPKHEPFDDIRVREAAALALDLELVVEELLGGRGRVVPALVPPNAFGFNSDLEPYGYDPERARELLAEAGYPNGFTLDTNISDGRYVADRATYDVLNAQLAEVGIVANPQVVEWGRLLAMMAEGAAGPFYIIGWDFGEGVGSKMDSLFVTGTRQSRWSDPDYDELSRLGNAEMDAEKRAEYWRQAQQLVHERHMFLATWQTSVLYGASDRINWVSKYGDNIQLIDVTLAQ
ncbi:MAG: ABC transporter substrate-binding protein [Acidimicrobiia bacterium]